MQKNIVRFEVERDGKVFYFECDPDSSLGSIFDALSQMQNYVMEKMKELAPKKEENKEDQEK